MIVANIFDFIDGKVAHELQLQSQFGAFWDSTLDRFSDLALLTGLIFLYSKLGRSDYVMVAALTLIFSIMTSYARARAESLVEKCKVGFMERPERIVLFMIGAFTNRMAAVLWVILVLSILAVANRIYYTYLALNNLPMPSTGGRRAACSTARSSGPTSARRSPYDLWVIAILAFVWLTPPDWLGDPTADRAWACWAVFLQLSRLTSARRLQHCHDFGLLPLAHCSIRLCGFAKPLVRGASPTPSWLQASRMLRRACASARAAASRIGLRRLLLAAAHAIEALAQRLHQVDDLRRLLDLRRDDLLARRSSRR